MSKSVAQSWTSERGSVAVIGCPQRFEEGSPAEAGPPPGATLTRSCLSTEHVAGSVSPRLHRRGASCQTRGGAQHTDRGDRQPSSAWERPTTCAAPSCTYATSSSQPQRTRSPTPDELPPTSTPSSPHRWHRAPKKPTPK